MDIKTYRTLFDSISEGIVLLDEGNIITQVNESAARMLGRDEQELVGSSLQEILPFLDKSLHSGSLQAIGQAEIVNILSSQGQETLLAVTSAPLKDVPPHKRALVLRDVTALQSAHQMQTYFLANITHEFRTPLAALKASVELMLDSLGEVSQSEIERLLKSVHYSVASLQTLIDNLLESASIESGHFRIQLQQARLGDIIGEAVRVMSPLLQRREQGLQIEMDWSMPPIYVDPTRIAQVIVNLLSNASKYSPMGKGIRVRVSPSADSMVLISIVDQGTGLSFQDREKLFKKFVRLNDITGEQYGIGLGLSVVKTIVEAHGGSVGVEENPEGGSIFWFTVPANISAETSP